MYYDEEKQDGEDFHQTDLERRLEERSKRNVATNRNFEEFLKK